MIRPVAEYQEPTLTRRILTSGLDCEEDPDWTNSPVLLSAAESLCVSFDQNAQPYDFAGIVSGSTGFASKDVDFGSRFRGELVGSCSGKLPSSVAAFIVSSLVGC